MFGDLYRNISNPAIISAKGPLLTKSDTLPVKISVVIVEMSPVAMLRSRNISPVSNKSIFGM